MRWVWPGISGIKETLEEMASEAREDREKIISMFEELNFAAIKESLDKMTYDARKERDNLNNMMAELLAEAQQTE